MGLIQVPHGIQTRRGYAPADIARSAAESEAPWLWRGIVRAGVFQHGVLRYLTPQGMEPATTTFSPRGPGFQPGHKTFADPIQGLSAASCLAVVWMDSAPGANESVFSNIANIDSTNYGWGLLADNSDYESGNADTFSMQWNRSNTRQMTTGPNSVGRGLHFIASSYRDGVVRLAHNGMYLGQGGAVNATYTVEAGTQSVVDIGPSQQGFATGTLSGQLLFFALADERWLADELQLLSSDPYILVRRRPLLIPVSGGGGGGGTAVSLSDSAQNADTWGAVATAPAAVTESVQAADALAAIAMVSMALTEAVSAQDSDAGPAQALGALSEAATGSALADAIAQASAAITAGAAAGEAWVVYAQAVVDLIESSAASEEVVGAATNATQGAINEGSQAGDAFAEAINAVTRLTDAVSAADAFIAVAVSLTTVTESVQAGDSWSTGSSHLHGIVHSANASDTMSPVAQCIEALTEAVAASAIYTAAVSVTAAIAEAVSAGDTWSAVVPGTGYLVASAITITAALSGSASITPALSGSVSIKPD